jgi:hypothetical protein
MLWDAAAINGYAIEASDGQLGTVSDLLFEDAGWVIRWLFVDTGHRLPGRKVLLPLSILGQPDRALRHFLIKLTMQQVKDSPDVDTDLPVSRQIEAQVHDYFGWNPYWSGSFVPMSNAMTAPFVAPLYEPQSALHDMAGADAHPNEVTRVSAALQLSSGAIFTPATVGSVTSRISSWTMPAGTSVTSNWTPGTGGQGSGC